MNCHNWQWRFNPNDGSSATLQNYSPNYQAERSPMNTVRFRLSAGVALLLVVCVSHSEETAVRSTENRGELLDLFEQESAESVTFKANDSTFPVPVASGAFGGPVNASLIPGMSDPQSSSPRLSTSLAVNEHSSVGVYGSADPATPVFGCAYSMNDNEGFLRQASFGVSNFEGNGAYYGGLTGVIHEGDQSAIATRVLLGGSYFDGLNDRIHVSTDLYAGHRLADSDNWIKYGAFVDIEEDLGKFGPALGLLLNSTSKHPLTVDFALGFGLGDDVTEDQQTFYRAADYDAQLRLGTFLTRSIQTGVTVDYASWNDARYGDEELGVGGFCNLYLNQVQVQLDVTGSSEGARGFVNLVYHFGSPANSVARAYKVNGHDWLLRPINRDPGVRVRRRNDGGGGVGNISSVACIVRFPGQDTTGDNNNNQVVDPDEGFEIDFQFTNTSTQTATNVSFGQNTTVQGPGIQAGGVGGTFGDLLPGQTARTNTQTDACIEVNATAVAGDQIFVEFDVTADGQTRRFRCGPFIVGQIRDGDTDTASPL